MSRFPDGHHLASWAGMCPGHNESGGKRKSGKTRKGNRWLRSTLQWKPLMGRPTPRTPEPRLSVPSTGGSAGQEAGFGRGRSQSARH